MVVEGWVVHGKEVESMVYYAFKCIVCNKKMSLYFK